MRMITSTTKGATSLTPPPRIGSVAAREVLEHPDQHPADDGARHAVQAPRMTTGNTFRPRSASEKSTPPRTLPRMMPASVGPPPVAMHHDSAKTHFTLTPSDCATCWLSAVARIAMPVARTERKARTPRQHHHAHKAPTDAPATPAPARRGTARGEQHGDGRVSLPHVMLKKPADDAREPEVTMDHRDDRLADEGRSTPAR